MKKYFLRVIFSLSSFARIFLTSGVIFSTLFSIALAEGPTEFAPMPTIVPTGAPQSLEAVLELLSTLTGWMFAFVLVIAVGAIIAGGIMYVTSGGNEKRSGTGTKMLIYALIGVVIAGMAWAIVNITGNLIFGKPVIPTTPGECKIADFICINNMKSGCYSNSDTCVVNEPLCENGGCQEIVQ